MLKLNMSVLFLFAGSVHAMPVQETDAMAFPKDISCNIGSSIGETEGRSLLPDVLARVGSIWQPGDFQFIAQVDGVGSHHLVFNLHHNNIPVEKQELILSIDNNCQLFRYQYRVVDYKPKEDAGNNSKIKSIDEAITSLKTIVANPDEPLTRSIQAQANRLRLLNKADHSQLPASYVADEITGSPLYRISSNKVLILGYQLNLPSRNPDGLLELWWNSQRSSPSALPRFPYAKRSDKQSIPALSPWQWQGYGQHPQRTLGTDYVVNFWEVWPPISQSLSINTADKLQTANLVFLDSLDFSWDFEDRTFAELWNNSDSDADSAAEKKRKLTSILTNVAYADKGIGYAANTLGYGHLLPSKPSLVLSTTASGGSSIYKPAFDIIQIVDNSCNASLYDPGATLHEQGHSVFVRLLGLSRSNPVNTAMNEGFADYWAAGFLRQDPKWNGSLSDFRSGACGKTSADRQLRTQLYDYFDGMEAKISSSHGGITGPEGKVFFEPMLAQPLLAAMEDLIKLHGEEKGRKLADHIVLETFAGLSVDASYRELSQALLVNARRFDPSLKAEAIYRLRLTNSNLLPRQVEPESRVAIATIMPAETSVTLVNHDSANKAERVTVALPNQVEQNIELAASEKRALTLPSPQLTCGEVSSQPLMVRHWQDNKLVQNKAYPFTLVGGQQSGIQSFEKENNVWSLTLSKPLVWKSDNARHVLRLKGDSQSNLIPKLINSDTTIDLASMARTSGSLWLSADSNTVLASGKWQLTAKSDYTSAELVTLECVPAFTIDGPASASEKSTLTFKAMLNGSPITVQWQVIGEDSASNSETFSLAVPDLAQSKRYEIEAVYTLNGEKRTVRHAVDVDAVNHPATFEISAPTEVSEGQSVAFAMDKLSDPDSAGFVQADWYIGDDWIGQGQSIQWQAPTSDTDRTLVLSLKVRDSRQPVETAVSKSMSIALKHVNVAPTISLNAPVEVQAGKLLEVSALVSDKETAADKLTVSWKISGIASLTLPAGKQLSWTVPASVTVSALTVTAEVSDGEATATVSRVINLKPANKAPVLSLTGPINTQAGQSVEVSANWTDETPEKVKLSWQVNGVKVPFEQLSNEKIRLNIPKNQGAGSVQVQVTADDSEASAVETHRVSWGAYVNQVPTVAIAGPAKANIGDSITLTADAQDPDRWPAALQFTWQQVSGERVVLKANGSSLQFSVPASASESVLVFELDTFDGETHTKKQWRIDVAKYVIPNPVITLKNDVAGTYKLNELSELVLDASTSRGAGSEDLIFKWKQVSGPVLSDLPLQGEQIKVMLPEVGSLADIELELTVSQGSRVSRKIIRVAVSDLGPAPREAKIEPKAAGSNLVLDAESVVELADGIDYQFNWEQVKGTKVAIANPNVRVLNVELPSSANEEELGFSLAITTPGKGVRHYPVSLKVAAAPESKPEPTTATKPQTPSSSDGGSGGSFGLWGLLALLGTMLLRGRGSNHRR
ncbi:hypothetical protein L4D08_19680 [Photobacterium chitinilyticum]|uniref:hypothetical protein n=1 Tax=Photobacterium chitinilyticum TaxID=2485123 RepID=UPI003D0CE7EA